MLKTEERNAKTMHVDKMSTNDMLSVMQEENMNAVKAVAMAQDSIANAVDEISLKMSKGGRLFYVGCGTSGRLGVLDASECPPTFGVPNDLVIGIIAGGDGALRNAIEGAEDNAEAGVKDLSAFCITDCDSVIGISVAGGAEYVLGAIKYAKERGALTVGISSNKGSQLLSISNIPIFTDTGAEVITGSTRLKAGTAHKMILNMISTAIMIKQGYVYENLMINLKPTNKKLKQRMIRITATLTDIDEKTAESILEKNGFNIRNAVTDYKQNSTL